MTRRTIVGTLLAAAVFAGCDKRGPGQSSAVLTITVTPNPVVITLACPAPPDNACLASLDPTITISEGAGVGGRVEQISILIRGLAEPADITYTLGPDWLRNQTGTDRIEAFGRVALRPVVSGYRIGRNRVQALRFVFGVRFVDDNGNVVEASAQVGGA